MTTEQVVALMIVTSLVSGVVVVVVSTLFYVRRERHKDTGLTVFRDTFFLSGDRQKHTEGCFEPVQERSKHTNQ